MRSTPLRPWRLLLAPLYLASASVVLALGCGDSAGPDGDDEAAGDTTGTGGESSGGSGNAEAGSEGNDANTTDVDGSGEGGSGSSAGTASDTADAGTDADTSADAGSETATGGDSTETGEPPPNCLLLDEPTCSGMETCVPYLGQPYLESIDGMTCLGEPQFIGCLFAADACLPATGTLCMGEQAYHVDNLCPPPEGFGSCEPPVDPVMNCP